MQNILNILAIILRVSTNSLCNVFQKKLAMESEDSVSVNFITYLILSIASIPLLFFIDYSDLNLHFWFYAILGGIFGAVCNCFMLLALENGELSVLGPINSYKAIVGLIFGFIILHEVPTLLGLLGIILIIFGSYFIFDSANPKILFRKDIRYRIYALIFSAIEAVFIKKVIILSSITTSFVISSLLGCIFAYVIMKLFSKRQNSNPNKKHLILYFLTALCFGIMTFSTAYVFKFINVSYALSIFQISIIINVVLGYKLFKEKNLIKKLIGSLIILIGSAIIIIYGH